MDASLSAQVFLHSSSNAPFSTTWISSLNTTALWYQPAQEQQVKALGSFPVHAYNCCGYKTSLWEVDDAGRNSHRMGIPVMLQAVNIATWQQLAAKLSLSLQAWPQPSLLWVLTPTSLNAIFITEKEQRGRSLLWNQYIYLCSQNFGQTGTQLITQSAWKFALN